MTILYCHSLALTMNFWFTFNNSNKHQWKMEIASPKQPTPCFARVSLKDFLGWAVRQLKGLRSATIIFWTLASMGFLVGSPGVETDAAKLWCDGFADPLLQNLPKSLEKNRGENSAGFYRSMSSPVIEIVDHGIMGQTCTIKGNWTKWHNPMNNRTRTRTQYLELSYCFGTISAKTYQKCDQVQHCWRSNKLSIKHPALFVHYLLDCIWIWICIIIYVCLYPTRLLWYDQ